MAQTDAHTHTNTQNHTHDQAVIWHFAVLVITGIRLGNHLFDIHETSTTIIMAS